MVPCAAAIVPRAPNRQFGDGLVHFHILDRDSNEFIGYCLRAARVSHPGRPRHKLLDDALPIERLGALWPEYFEKMAGCSLPNITLASVTVSGPPCR